MIGLADPTTGRASRASLALAIGSRVVSATYRHTMASAAPIPNYYPARPAAQPGW
jgi:hypothetical protein